jgi:alanine racemase
MRSRHVVVSIDLDRVRVSAEHIRATTGVALIAVIKADAYGLGAARVADVLATVADDFAYFSIHEAREVGRPGLVLGPPEGDPAQYRELKLRPSITNRADAEKYAGLPSAVNVDTGMQRFGCPAAEVDDLLRRCGADEAYTHTDDPQAVTRLQQACGGRVRLLHAAASGLLNYPETWLDAVRPGVALYLGAVRVSTRLVAIRPTHGRAGYSGFEWPLVGIILAGYSHHLRAGPVLINGRRQRILEVGMNTSFVSVDPADHSGDEVVLLGDELAEAKLAQHFQTREHEVLCRYSSMGMRQYEPAPTPAATDSPGTTISTAAALPQT